MAARRLPPLAALRAFEAAARHLSFRGAAAELSLTDLGVIAKGALADLVVLDRDLTVRQTYIAGQLVYSG